MITYSCPGCETKIKIADEGAGRKVKCPVCSSVDVAPKYPDVRFPCGSCGKMLAVTCDFPGKKAKCPACKELTVVPPRLIAGRRYRGTFLVFTNAEEPNHMVGEGSNLLRFIEDGELQSLEKLDAILKNGLAAFETAKGIEIDHEASQFKYVAFADLPSSPNEFIGTVKAALEWMKMAKMLEGLELNRLFADPIVAIYPLEMNEVDR